MSENADEVADEDRIVAAQQADIEMLRGRAHAVLGITHDAGEMLTALECFHLLHSLERAAWGIE